MADAATHSWRLLAQAAGLHRAADLPLLLWPLLWATWLASGGAPEFWRFAALLVAVLLARSAAWAAWYSDAEGPRQIFRERRPFVWLLTAASFCFALPLGWAGLTVPLGLMALVAWLDLRRRSYLSDAVLILALLLPVAGAWWIQLQPAAGVAAIKGGGLLLLGTGLWLAAALVALWPGTGLHRGASFASLAGPRGWQVAAFLKAAALGALFLAGRQMELGPWYWAGLAAALLLLVIQVRGVRRRTPPSWLALEPWSGALVFAGLALHFA